MPRPDTTTTLVTTIIGLFLLTSLEFAQLVDGVELTGKLERDIALSDSHLVSCEVQFDWYPQFHRSLIPVWVHPQKMPRAPAYGVRAAIFLFLWLECTSGDAFEETALTVPVSRGDRRVYVLPVQYRV